MSLKVTGVYFSASSAGPGTGKMKATIRAARQHNNHHQQQQQQQQTLISSPPNRMTNHDPSPNGRLILGSGNQSHLHSQSQSLDYLHNRHQQQHHPLNFEEKRQIIASSLSLVDFLHRPPVKVKGNTTTDKKNIDTSRTQKRTNWPRVWSPSETLGQTKSPPLPLSCFFFQLFDNSVRSKSPGVLESPPSSLSSQTTCDLYLALFMLFCKVLFFRSIPLPLS